MRTPCTEEKRLKIKESNAETRQRRTRQTCRVFKVKVDNSKLSKKQKEQLKMMFVEGKWLRNDRLAWAKNNHKSIFDCEVPHKHEKVHVKTKTGEFEERELKHIGSQMAQGVVAEMKSNLKTILRLQKKGIQKHGELKFVSELKSINLWQYGCTYSFKSAKRMKIQGVSGLVAVNGVKQFIEDKDIEIASAKLLNTPQGYFVAVTTYIDNDKLEKPISNGKTIGLDFGCQTSITYSDGRRQNVVVGETERLKNLQRKLSRQVKGSNNSYRTKRLIGVEYQKITNRRNDLANKIVGELKSYERIVIQDEQLAKWKKSGHGRAVQHSCLGRVKAKLMKMDNVVVLDKFIPTTKICMKCGRTYNMPQSQREFNCVCGSVGDRDVHAAQNMVDIARLILENKVSVPMGRRELMRVDFLETYQKKFEIGYRNMKHEAACPLGRR